MYMLLWVSVLEYFESLSLSLSCACALSHILNLLLVIITAYKDIHPALLFGIKLAFDGLMNMVSLSTDILHVQFQWLRDFFVYNSACPLGEINIQ